MGVGPLVWKGIQQQLELKDQDLIILLTLHLQKLMHALLTLSHGALVFLTLMHRLLFTETGYSEFTNGKELTVVLIRLIDVVRILSLCCKKQ